MAQNDPPKISAIPGLAIVGLLLTGIAGMVHAFMFEAGMGLLAAAVAFGTLLYVSFR
jgi:hypothetical protein